MSPFLGATTYTYDALYRLTQVTYDNGASRAYSYDTAGNLLSVINAAPTGTVTTYSLTTALSGTGIGTISGLACTSPCTASYASGASVTLTATPATGSGFTGWSGACVGTGICLVTMSAAQTVTASFSLNSGASTFVGVLDSFESAGLADWTTGTGPYTRSVTNSTAAKGSGSLYLSGGKGTNSGKYDGGFYDGISRTLASVTPSFISFYAKAAATTGSFGYFVIGDSGTIPPAGSYFGNDGIIYFSFSDGVLSVYDGTGSRSGGPFVANTWYLVEFRNINWSTKTYDFYVNGVLKRSAVRFRSQATTALTQLYLYNYDNAQVWFDEISIGSIGTAPGAPTNVVTTSRSGSAIVSFVAPVSDGGAPITGYIVTCGNVSASGTVSPITVSGLTDGTPYTCSVVAKNSAGNSTASATVSVTPMAAVLPTPQRRLSDTGQINCWDSTGLEISCAGTGQDAAYNINAQSFTDNGDGTVTDNVSGLMWMGSDKENPDHPAGLYKWYQASGVFHATHNSATRSVCGEARSAGYNDWRLPSKRELLGIVSYAGLSGAAINPVFKNTKSYKYWTATPTDFGPNDAFPNAWYVDFNYGEASNGDKNGAQGGNYLSYARCVRGELLAGQLTDNGDGTVTDSKTSLMWQQGGAPNYDLPYSWDGALNYCEALTDGGHTDWRLPNVKELESLTVIDSTKFSPPIDKTLFPNARQWKYWTSSTFASPWENATWTKKAWTVDFTSIGSVNRGDLYPFSNPCNGEPNDKSGCYFKYYARCVRSLPETLPSGDPATNQRSDCLFNWAEASYSSVFPRGAQSQSVGQYYLRHYPQTNAYLAVSSGNLYYMGPLSQNSVLDLGAAANWQATAGCK